MLLGAMRAVSRAAAVPDTGWAARELGKCTRLLLPAFGTKCWRLRPVVPRRAVPAAAATGFAKVVLEGMRNRRSTSTPTIAARIEGTINTRLQPRAPRVHIDIAAASSCPTNRDEPHTPSWVVAPWPVCL